MTTDRLDLDALTLQLRSTLFREKLRAWAAAKPPETIVGRARRSMTCPVACYVTEHLQPLVGDDTRILPSVIPADCGVRLLRTGWEGELPNISLGYRRGLSDLVYAVDQYPSTTAITAAQLCVLIDALPEVTYGGTNATRSDSIQ